MERSPFSLAVTVTVIHRGAVTDCNCRAEFTDGPFAGRAVEGFPTSDEAIGALVRMVAGDCTSPDEVIDLVARMFDRPTDGRTPDETLGRAIRFANRVRERRNPGLKLLTFVRPEAKPPKPPATSAALKVFRTAAKARQRGGVA